MKAVIFVPSTSLIRGPKWLAPKAGFFYLSAKGGYIPISSGPSLPSAKKRTARESGLVDSGIWRAAFLSVCNVNKSRNAHRNHNATRGETPAGNPPAFANPIHRTGKKTPCPARTVANPAGLRFTGNSGRKTSIILSDSVF